MSLHERLRGNADPTELAGTLLELADLNKPVQWKELFGNDGPVEIEVGCGKGLFLITAGPANPQTNYLGIEIARKYAHYSAARVAKRHLRNVRVLVADAREFLAGYVASASVRAVHAYFPDPWWKRRHKKRRVFNDASVEQIERVLQVGGRLYVWTDVEEYFHAIADLIGRHTRLQTFAGSGQGELPRGMDYLTNFERKMDKAGRQIFRGCYCKSK